MGGHAVRGAVGLTLTSVALLVLTTLLPAPSAWAAGTATVSDTEPAPGQVITVEGLGLQPGAPVLIDLFGDAVRLGQTTVAGDGTFAQAVQIPDGTTDGPKALQITSIDDVGRYSSIVIDLVVTGPPASARLDTTSLRPGQTLGISGTRFRPGGEVYLVLFPEEVLLGSPVAAGDGTFATGVRLPAELVNGKHGIVVAGATAGGSFAYLVLEAQASGGTGSTPDGYTVPRNHPLALGGTGSASGGTTTGGRDGGSGGAMPSSSSTASSTTVARGASAGSAAGSGAPSVLPAPTGGPEPAVVLLLLLTLGAVVTLVLVWLRSSDGRRWRKRQWAELRRRTRLRRGSVRHH